MKKDVVLLQNGTLTLFNYFVSFTLFVSFSVAEVNPKRISLQHQIYSGNNLRCLRLSPNTAIVHSDITSVHSMVLT